MASKRNAALEALSAPPPKLPTAVASAQPVEGAENVVTLKPAKSSKTVAKVVVYMPPKVARKFKEIAFTEDRKANDVYLEALDLYLTQQGHGGLKGVTSR
jgi:hypothetical protein